MLIEDYFNEIKNVIRSFTIVKNFNLDFQKREKYLGFIKGNTIFTDDFCLHIREFIDVEIKLYRGKYSYQYMSVSNDLIFRYDNANHHQKLNLANFPHHKHEYSEDNIIASNAPFLKDVIKEIEHFLITNTNSQNNNFNESERLS